jgi:hypothetical protein
MATCFVIQPFDSGKFDKRFDGVYKPAIEAAGLEPYRVDRDPHVEIPIDAIESGIRNAALCLADITSDNPNVWYELGYAFATGRQVVMICSDERSGPKFPFDIQHRSVISYRAEAPLDFDNLRASITERLKALLTKNLALRQLEEAEQVAPASGLSQPELMVLANLAGDAAFPGGTTSLYSLKADSERSGLTAIGFSLALRRLVAKRMVETMKLPDDRGEEYDGARLTEGGWSWLDVNESLFVLRKTSSKKGKLDEFVDDIPF